MNFFKTLSPNSTRLWTSHTSYWPLLMICSALFAFRVLAQLVQRFYEVPYLPAFESWHSGALSYTWLLFFQTIILTLMIYVSFLFFKAVPSPSLLSGLILGFIGSVYFKIMYLRLIIGIFFLPNHFWFGALLPALFHLALAGFIIIIACFHCQIPAWSIFRCRSYE